MVGSKVTYKEVPLGSKVSFSFADYEINAGGMGYRNITVHTAGWMLARRYFEESHGNDFCIGWRERPSHRCHAMGGPSGQDIDAYWDFVFKHGESADNENRYTIATCPDYKNFPYVLWGLSKNTEFTILEDLNFQNQKCAGCNLSSPHEKPNFGTRYICKICSTLVLIENS